MAPLDSEVNSARSSDAAPKATRSRRRRIPRWPFALGIIGLVIVLLVVFWDWNWFRPIVEQQASGYLGRKVTLRHLDIKLSRTPTVILDGIAIANPDGFPAESYFVTVDRLAVTADAIAYIRGRQIVIPAVAVEKPVIDAEQLPDGRATWDFKLPASTSKPSDPPQPQPKIGDLRIADGQAHVVMPKVKADFQLGISTQNPEGGDSQIVVDIDGKYANQPITGKIVGGAVLSLREAGKPYPLDVKLANGPTHVTASGTVSDPLAFAGANIKLKFDGPDMALLMPLTGIPLPKTPPFSIAGNLDYTDKRIRFRDFQGRLGSSDIGGTIAVDPGKARPVVETDLVSKRVDLADLGGFVGSQPGRTNTPGQTTEQRRAVANAEASSQLLPTAKISLPKLRAADIHLNYHADKIAGRNMPFDDVTTRLDIVDGAIDVHPLVFGVGSGQIAANIALSPADGDDFHTKADVKLQRIDLGRLLASTNLVKGTGVLGGAADIDSTGNSVSTIIGHGNGELKVFLAGGNLSALIVDLAGLQFGDALLSALGIPNRATLECFVGDFALKQGALQTRTLIVDTSESVVNGTGSIHLGHESLDYTLSTDSKHFSIGTLPTPIHIGGKFKNPSIAPEVGPLALRGGAAVGLGILFPPAALLPTIQFGVGDDTGCSRLARQSGSKAAAAKANGEAPAKASAPRAKSGRRKPASG